MDYAGIEVVKNVYADNLNQSGRTTRALAVKNKKFQEPIFEGYTIHPEEEPNLNEMRDNLAEIGFDIYALDEEFIHAAENYEGLVLYINNTLKAVDEIIAIEQERIEDINMICGNMKEFSTVRTMTAKDFTGSCSYMDDDRTFTVHANDRHQVPIGIIDVKGNGYEGNKYVYKDGKFLKETINTSNRINATDNSYLTAYEYSRITMNRENDMPADANLDTEEAQCSIIVYGKESFNTMRIESDVDDIILEDLQVSDDNIAYTSALNRPVALNKKGQMYNYSDYIYGAGVLSFPTTNYVKLQFKSNGTADETLAYEKVATQIIDGDSIQTTKPVELETAKRHVIRLNNIKAMVGQYSKKSSIVSGELISNPVTSIAIFADEYIPAFFESAGETQTYVDKNDNDYIHYQLVVNGQEYDIVPLNSHKPGTKVIRSAEYLAADSYVKHINESIKSAYLKITMQTPEKSSSPYLSNLKICLGKAAIK